MIIIWNTDHFQKNLAFLRKRRNLTIQELSDKLGASAALLRSLETGEVREADSLLLQNLFQELGMPSSHLFSQYLCDHSPATADGRIGK